MKSCRSSNDVVAEMISQDLLSTRSITTQDFLLTSHQRGLATSATKEVCGSNPELPYDRKCRYPSTRSQEIAEQLCAGVELEIDSLIFVRQESLSKMTCFSYQAMGASDDKSKSALAIKENKDLSPTMTAVDTDDCLDFMACVYSSESTRVLNESKDLRATTTTTTTTIVDTGDCLDFLTRICILVPYETDLDEEIELPESFTSYKDEKFFVHEEVSFDDGRNSTVEDTHMLANSTQPVNSNDGYDLTSIVEDPPIHFAKTDRHYGCCPLGHQETIYFKEVTTSI